MTAYTSTQAGNWNSAATWGGGGFPNNSADSATIAHTVTIPSGVTVTASVAINAGKSLVNNGTLNLAGNMVPATGSTFSMGAGAVLDLNGFNVAPSGDVTYSFVGTALSRITIRSTGSRGAFTGGAFPIISTYDYVDTSGLADSTGIGRTHTNASGFLSYQHSTWTDCGTLALEATGTGANAGFIVSRCRFRNPYTTGKSVYVLLNDQALGNQQRTIEYCTFDSNGNLGLIDASHTEGLNWRRNVVRNWECRSAFTSAQKWKESLWSRTDTSGGAANSIFTSGYTQIGSIIGCYFYYPLGDHPMVLGSAEPGNFHANVFECPGPSMEVANWFLWSTTSAVAVNILHNVFLGQGNVMCFTNNGSPLITFKRNTVYIANNGATSGTHGDDSTTLALAPTLITEQASTALTGTVNISYNMMINPSGTRDRQCDTQNNTADQITTLDYNNGWDFGGGLTSPPVKYDPHVTVTSGVGTHDTAVNPTFSDRTRNLAAWDASLGGPGTAANAITELMKQDGNVGTYNTAYNVPALMSYIFAGFRTGAPSLRNSADTGGPIGAGNYYKSTRSSTTLSTFRARINSTYTGVSV